MWLIYLIIGGILLATQTIITRKHMTSSKSALVITFFTIFVGFIFSLFFLMFNIESWQIVKPFVGIIILSSFVGLFQIYCNNSSYKYLSPSIALTISKIQYVFIIIGSIFFFSEKFGVHQIIGSMLIIGASLLILNYTKTPINSKGIFWRIGSAFFFAVYAFLSKLLVTKINPFVVYGFSAIGSSVTLLTIMALAGNFKEDIKKTLSNKSNVKYLVSISLLVSVASLMILYGLSQAPVSITYLIIEAVVILAVIGEHFFLSGDRKHFFKKMIAVVLALVGVWLIKTF